MKNQRSLTKRNKQSIAYYIWQGSYHVKKKLITEEEL